MKVGDSYHGLKLLAYCGGGAYGEVFYCEDLTHRKMAVKIISKQRIGPHWRRELKGITNYRRLTLDAPNLLRIYQVEEDENNFFYTMEAADSLSSAEYKADTLAARLENGALPDKDIFSIISGIFEGIKTIHAAGFAHRDIKPDNILFVNGVPKLADLGLLSSLSMTMTALAGTFEFIPPEIRSADDFFSHDNISRQKCDLYAFGKVVYCIVTGRDALSFPSIPEDISRSLPVKYCLRLSWQLCSHEPAKRQDNLANVEKALSIIENKLLFGENWLDKLCYLFQQSQKNDKSFLNELLGIKIKPRTWALIFAIISSYMVITNLISEEHIYTALREQTGWILFLVFFFWLLCYVILDIVGRLAEYVFHKPK